MDIRLSDGSRRNVVVEDRRGDARRPLVADEVDTKFLSLAGSIDHEVALATLSWLRNADLNCSVMSLGRD